MGMMMGTVWAETTDGQREMAMPECQCGTCRSERWANKWREMQNTTYTLPHQGGAPTRSARPSPVGRNEAWLASLTATGVTGAGRSSGSREDRMKLVTNISHLNDWEIQPLLFLSERLLSGQREYGPERKYRDWQADIAEEAADIIAYYAWLRYERENP